MFTIKKKGKKEDVPSAMTGSLGGDVPSADKVESAPFKGADLSALAKLRSAKKKPQGEVSLGPTEIQEAEATSPAREKYLERLKKRAK